MSRYDWERGEFVFSTRDWPGVKKYFREIWNTEMHRRLDLSQKIHEALLTEGKGKRNFDFRAAFHRLARSPRFDIPDSFEWRVEQALFKQGETKPRKPQKKDFSLANAKTMEFSDDDAYIGLQDKERRLEWSVSENNHAVDRARASLLGQALFRLLRKTVWTRGTGGYIKGNDEYNRDQEDVGEGGNYLKDCFGPLGEKAGEQDAKNRGLARYRGKRKRL